MIEKKKLLIKEEIILGKKSVLIELDAGINIIDYEREMINNNPSLSFLKIETKKFNNNLSLIYNVGSRYSLNDYIRDEKLTIHEKIKISEMIFKKISIIHEYILDNRKLVIDADKIYLDKNSMSIYMIYLPIDMNYELKIEDELRKLYEELFSDAGKFKKELSVIERKLITGLISRNSSLDRIQRLFLDYSKLNSSDSLERRLYGDKKEEEDSKKEILEEKAVNEEKEKEKKIKKITYASVIDENYDDFDGFDESDLFDEEDDDYIQYKEYKELQEYDKKLNDNKRIRYLLNLQFYILIIFSAMAVILGSDNMKTVIIIVVIITILAVIFNSSLTRYFYEGEEDSYEEI